MSSASVTSNRREKVTQDLEQELEALQAMNNKLREYLGNLQVFKHNLAAMHKNCKQLGNVNSQWLEILQK